MSEWKESELEEVIECLIDYRGKTPKKTKIGVPLITAKIIKGGAISTPDEFIADSDYDSWMVRGYPQKGDVVLTTEAPLGEVAQLDNKKIALAQRVVCLRGKKDILDNTYLKYYFISKRGHTALTSKGTGTTVIGIKQSELRKVNVVYPPLPTQRRISAILSSLDAKIENNNKVNAKLEEIAQNLFKEWFVDFGPFKDGKFVDSELGPIPEGWRVVSLGEIIDTTSGGTPSRKNDEFYIGGKYNWVKSKELNGGYILATEELITEDAIKKSAAKLLPNNSVLVAMYGATVGEFGIISKEMTCNQAICALLPNEKVPYSFLFMLAKNKKEELINMAVGSAQQNISQVLIKELKIAYNEETCLRFHSVVEPIFEKKKNIDSENLQLTTLRDTLLPKLMSGEIKV